MKANIQSINLRFALCALGVIMGMPAVAFAQPAAVEQHAEAATDEAPEANETAWNASLGGTLNTGNTESWQLNAGSDLRLVRGPNAFGANFGFAYGQANIKDDASDDYKDTVKNLNAKLRYDYFFTEMDALFVAAGFRWDEFAGLDSRIFGQLGYLRNFMKEDNHRFWGEFGYDITLDNFHPDPLLDPDTGAVLDGDQVVHSGRVFLGYDNKINEALTYLGGLEALINVEDPEDTRINWDNALRSSIAGNLQLELKFSLLFDNVPVPGADKVDTATIISLIYNLVDEKEEAPPEPCPVCEELPAGPTAAPEVVPEPTEVPAAEVAPVTTEVPVAPEAAVPEAAE